MGNDLNHKSISTNLVNTSTEKLDFEYLLNSIVRLTTEDKEGVGFIISKEGHILTNAHILDGSLFCYGYLQNDTRPIKFNLIDFDDPEQLDVCILKPEGTKIYTPLKFSSKNPMVGQTVFTIGNPRNLGMSLSKGFVSQIKSNQLQLDMTLNPGNSGGPVFDEEGFVVGMISYILKDVHGLGFAVSLQGITNYVHRLGLSFDKIFLSTTTLSNHLLVDDSFYARVNKVKHIIKRPLYIALTSFIILVSISLIIVLSLNKTMTFIYQGEVIREINGFIGRNISNELPVLEESGKIFDGWYTNPEFTTKFDGEKIPGMDITLYPKFNDQSSNYFITFETNGGEPIATITANEQILTNLPIPKKEGHIFTQWFIDESLTNPYIEMSNSSDITLYAEWILEIYDFTENIEYITIDSYHGDELYIEIPGFINQKPVTHIGNEAFTRISAIEVTLPDTLEVIGDFAFAYMANVQKIKISSTSELKTIGKFAFVMDKTSNITELYIPPKVNFIGETSNYSQNFESFIVDDLNTTYASIDGVLYNKELTQLINYPSGKKDASFEVIASVISFDKRPFAENMNLQQLSFHEESSLKILPSQVFENIFNLKTLYLPPNLQIMDPYVAGYQGFLSLENIFISEANEYFKAVDHILYDIDMESIYLVASKKSGILNIPTTVTSIKSYAFTNSQLSDIYIPSSTIDIIYDAFKGAKNIYNFHVDLENPLYIDVDGVLMTKDLSKLVAFPPARSGNYVVPKEVKTIGESSFFNTGLEIVKFEEGSLIFSIEYHAFTSPNLEEVYIPNTVMIVSYLTFAMHPGMTIYVQHEEKPSGWRDGWASTSNTIIWGYTDIYG